MGERHIGRIGAMGLAMALFLLGSGAGLRGATPAEVEQSLAKAKEFLYGQQKDGHWETVAARVPTTKGTSPADQEGPQWGGKTALVTYALLAAGENPQDPRIQKAVEFLRKADMIGVYAIGMRVQVWNLLPKSAEVKQAIYKDAQFLRRAMKTARAARGFYDYTNNEGTRYDHSVSQYGVLGAWACAEWVEGITDDYWRIVDAAWRADQQPDGGWSYLKTPSETSPVTASMTCAGVATLFITQDFLNRGRSLEPNGNIKDPHIDRGLKWISDNYHRIYEGNSQVHYTLYGVERIGVASGYKYFGTTNWYEDGADYLVKSQAGNGGWSGVINTSFAVLFLTRGRAPVVMNKLDYDITTGQKVVNAPWNQRPRDVANLARYISRQSERALNWQIVNLKAPVEELHDAPILYMAGNQTLSFGPEEKQKLKQFVQQGGMILGHADGASLAFSRSFKKLGAELFPDYEFRPLPAEHTIYTNEQFPANKWRRKPNVLGLSNGVRELLLLLPDGDPARAWQAYDIGARSEYFELMADVFLYSVDKQNLRYKGETYLVSPDPKVTPSKTARAARLKYAGNWDPEPAGWPRLAAVMHNTFDTSLSTQTAEIASLPLADVKIAHLTGTGDVKFDAATRQALKGFVEGGGTLVVDVAGGSAAFATAMDNELEAIFGADAAKSLKTPLPEDHAIYRLTGRREIGYRSFTQHTITGDLHVGRLKALEMKGRAAVIYSSEDLSAGLVGQPVDGIIGYNPRTATSLMTNIILYAMGEKPPGSAATTPTTK